MSATTEQRRDAILTNLYQSGRVTIHDLAEQFEVSEATVRRDLKSLSDAGKVELVYGGATLPRKSDFSFRSKEMRHGEAKRIVGRLAAELVSDGDLIFLDSGTTCFAMTPFLKRRRQLSIIANSARLALEMGSPEIEMILLGGQYRPDRMDTVGPLAISTLEKLRGFTAFFGTDGLGMDFGITASDVESAYLHRVAIANAREAVLLADHSKFLSPSLVKIEAFDAVSKIVTDKRPSPDWLSFLDGRGIDVLDPESQTVSHAPPEAANTTSSA